MMNKIAIQVISDLHLEFHSAFPKFKPNAKYLFLAGDICTFDVSQQKKITNFLSYCSLNWQKVFYVPGNHEYYQSSVLIHKKNSMEEIDEMMKQICNIFPNVYLLNNSYEEIEPGINVYGTTFWTSRYGYPYYVKIEEKLNDYNMIATKTDKINFNTSLKEKYIDNLSDKQLEHMRTYLKDIKTDEKTIIMTHFPPIRDNVTSPRHSNSSPEMKNYFSWNDIYTTFENKENIIGWISGHTHWSYDIKKDNIRFISNQTGYINEYLAGRTLFKPDDIFELEY